MRFGEPGSDRSDDDRLSRMLSNRTSRLTADRVGEAGTLNPAGIGKQEIDTMLSRIGAAISVLSVVTGGLVLSTPAQAHDVRVGVMTCDMAGGFGYVLGSSRDLQCTFSPASGPAEHYAGTISKFGVDIGYVQNAVMVWTVVAPTVALTPGSLTGTYGGATASVTVGVGVGANVLVGGSSDTIPLQPVSIEGGTGLNVAGGFASMSLTFQPS